MVDAWTRHREPADRAQSPLGGKHRVIVLGRYAVLPTTPIVSLGDGGTSPLVFLTLRDALAICFSVCLHAGLAPVAGRYSAIAPSEILMNLEFMTDPTLFVRVSQHKDAWPVLLALRPGDWVMSVDPCVLAMLFRAVSGPWVSPLEGNITSMELADTNRIRHIDSSTVGHAPGLFPQSRGYLYHTACCPFTTALKLK